MKRFVSLCVGMTLSFVAVLLMTASASAATVAVPSATVQGCTVTFGNVPEGDHVAIFQGGTDIVVMNPADNPATLVSGSYSWEIQTGTGTLVGEVGTFTILPGCPPATVVTTCGGTATFSGVPGGWTVVIQPADISLLNDSDATGSVHTTLAPGTYTFRVSADTQGNFTEGTFTIVACPPSPTPCVKVTPSPTPPASTARVHLPKFPVQLTCPTPPPHHVPGPPNTGVPTPSFPLGGLLFIFFSVLGAGLLVKLTVRSSR